MNKFLKGLEYFFVINGLIYCLDLYSEEFTVSGLSFIKPLYTYSLMCVYIIFNSSSLAGKRVFVRAILKSFKK